MNAATVALLAAVQLFGGFADLVRQMHHEVQPGSIAQLRKQAAHFLTRIDAAKNLSERDQEELRGMLLSWASEKATDAAALRLDFLRSGNDDLAAMVIADIMRNELAIDTEEQNAIVALVRNAKAANATRVQALWALQQHQDPAFEVVARQVALDHADREMAHSAARILVASWQDRDRAQIGRGLQSPLRALREECAIAASAGEEFAPAALPILIATATDPDELPRVRGPAIANLGQFESDQAHDTLLRLLEPPMWFFGAGTQLAPVHSLGVVIDALKAQPREGDRGIFESLRAKLIAIPEYQRDFVEWRLNHALGIADP
jgi:hypothetical protein